MHWALATLITLLVLSIVTTTWLILWRKVLRRTATEPAPSPSPVTATPSTSNLPTYTPISDLSDTGSVPSSDPSGEGLVMRVASDTGSSCDAVCN